MSDNTEFLAGQLPTKSFRDVASKEMAQPPEHGAAEYANIKMLLESFEIREGTITQDGEKKKTKYAVLKCMDSDLEVIYIRCGGYLVMRQLDMISQTDDLPIYFTLKKDIDGKTWYLD